MQTEGELSEQSALIEQRKQPELLSSEHETVEVSPDEEREAIAAFAQHELVLFGGKDEEQKAEQAGATSEGLASRRRG
jgi:hypothetical protein